MLGTKFISVVKSCAPLYNKIKFTEAQKYIVRCNTTDTKIKMLESLTNRSILQVSGNESTEFLQGLITNDINFLKDGASNIYALFLNIRGRVLYDTIIYKTQENDVYYIECDTKVVDQLQKHLKTYKIRRKINIEPMTEKLTVWSLFNIQSTIHKDKDEIIKSNIEGLIFPCGILNNNATKFVENVMIYQDPRIPELGFRILSKSNCKESEILKLLNGDTHISGKNQNYKAFRYALGIGEGIDDLPPGKPLPLEINCDYLHGVSFHKGCYIGQELTARTHHTGVVRKRLMPLVFDSVLEKSIVYDENILDESNKIVGKFRGKDGKYGLGLMRITEALNAKQLCVSEIPVKVKKPIWWPQEQQKESITAT